MREYGREYRKANPDRIKVQDKRNYESRYERKPHAVRMAVIRKRCRTNNIACDIDEAFLEKIAVTHCPVLGIELNYRAAHKQAFSDSTAHLDRFDPNLGYIRGNVAFISGRANLLKRDGRLDEFEQLVCYLQGFSVAQVGSIND